MGSVLNADWYAEAVKKQYDWYVHKAVELVPALRKKVNELRHARGIDDYPYFPFKNTDEEYDWLNRVLRDEQALADLKKDPEMSAFKEFMARNQSAERGENHGT